MKGLALMSSKQLKGLNQLTKEVNKTLMQYSRNCSEEVYKAAEEVAQATVDTLKTTGNYEDRTGKYRKGFAVKKQNHYTYPSATVHNKVYRLTHLLENGHMKANGKGRTKAFPHWKPAEEKAVKEFEDKVKDKLKDVGV